MKEGVMQEHPYNVNKRAFERFIRTALKEYGGWIKARANVQAFTERLAELAFEAKMPEEEALMHAENLLTDRIADAEIEALRERFHLVYFAQNGIVPTDRQVRVQTETEMLELFLTGRYQFRFNELLGFTEYARATTSCSPDWQPVDERVVNGMTELARLEGINVWNRDVTRYVRSDMIPRYDALDDFMNRVDLTKWDKRDRIRELADTVPCRKRALWRKWLERWLMGVYMQWRPYLDYRPFGNAVVPLLIGPQGWGKSRFCERLLPPELKAGYTASLILDEKKTVLQAMNQLLLICLDEFNQYSAKVQAGFLKNVVQLSVVKLRPHYGTRQVEMPRLASFIATSNQHDVLADPSGSRRFIAIELTAPIDDTYVINHLQLFAQVAYLIHQKGKSWWFSKEETDVIIEHNRPYMMQQPVEQLFVRAFRPAKNTREGKWYLTSEIYEELRQRKATAPLLKNMSLIQFGRVLSANPEIIKKREKRGSAYRLVLLK